jgi:hypothetical protein
MDFACNIEYGMTLSSDMQAVVLCLASNQRVRENADLVAFDLLKVR